MTIAAALNNFFSGFTIPAYPSNAVPADVVFPWLTYDVIVPTDRSILTVDLWFYTDSEKAPNDLVNAMYNRIGRGGIVLSHDDGAIWIKRGSPFSTGLSDNNNPAIKRRSINLTIEQLL